MPGIIKKNAYSAVTAGSATIGAVAYNGTTQAAGQFDSGAVAPVHTNVLNYDGTFAATGLKLTPGGVGMQFGVVANGTVTALGPAASALSAYNYVVAISAAGGTMLNTLTGTSLTIGVANSTVVTISATGASVTGTLSTSGQVTSNAKNVLSVNDTQAGQAGVAITVGASPFAYTATYGGSVAVGGGTVTGMTLTRNSVVVWSTTLANDMVPVRAGDIVTVTYTTAPTIYQLSD